MQITMQTTSASPDEQRHKSHETQSNEASPASAEDGAAHDASEHDASPQKNTRSRACVACRGMKIKCRWLDDQDACVACAKVNRECVMPGPPKKRQKNKHKFAELEQKINALTEALSAKSKASDSPSNGAPTAVASTESYNSLTHTESIIADPNPVPASSYDRPITAGVLSAQMKEVYDPPVDCGRAVEKYDDYVDLVDQGKLDLQTACTMFNHWQTNMQPYFPLVVLPGHVKAEDVRVARPMLFLATMVVASPSIQPSLQAELVYEFNKEVSRRVLFHGEKSLDLVQGMLVYVKNYTRPRYAKDLIFNQYIHCAAVMCLDLGIGKKLTTGSLQNPIEEAEVRRTWVAAYYVGSSASILLRHPTLVRFSPYVEECLQFLTTSPYAAASDKWLVASCRFQRISEDVSVTFGIDEKLTGASFADPKTVHHLKAFEQQLLVCKRNVPKGVDTRLVNHIQSCCSLYMHEVAIYQCQNIVENNSKSNGLPANERSFQQNITAAHIDALSICLSSSYGVLDSWLALDLDTMRNVPNLYIVWNVYAMVSIIKIHGITYAPGSELENIFASDLRVECYLDAVGAALSECARGGRCPPAEGFGFIFKKLKSWYSQRKGQGPFSSEEVYSSIHASKKHGGDEDLVKPKPDKVFHQKFELPGANNAVSATPPPLTTTSDLNAAFDAANYNINWNDLNFSADELTTFNEYMNDPGWMGYLM